MTDMVGGGQPPLMMEKEKLKSRHLGNEATAT